MALDKQTKFRGLNLRQNDIDRDPSFASDLQNVELNSKAELIKRYGFAALAASPANTLNFFENKELSELLAMTTSGLSRWTGSAWEDVNYGCGDASPAISAYSLPVDTAEYNGVTYFTDPAGENYLMKYDGLAVYRAGLPQADIATAAAVGGHFFRVAVYDIDDYGNKVWGDYHQVEVAAYATNIGFSSSVDAKQFYQKYGFALAAAGGTQTINSGNLTLDCHTGAVLAAHNFIAGDRFRPSPDVDALLEVESVTANSITFTAASVGGDSFVYNDDDEVERVRLVWNLFYSPYESYGYHLVQQGVFAQDLMTATSSSGTYPSPYTDGDIMEDVYDTTIVKGLAPKCKYIAMYNNVMVLLNRIKEGYSTATDIPPDLRDAIYWSDTGVGSTVETFGPFDYEPIGKTSEGETSGIYADQSGVIVFKENHIYYINGLLTGRQFRETRAPLSGIGCVSYQSITEVDGGCLFMSSKGVYGISNFGKPVEFTDIIEPLFTEDTTGLDLTLAVGALDVLKEKFYMYIPATLSADDVVLVYDYYYKEWFKYKGISATNGFIVFENDLYHHNGTTAYKRSSTFTDAGSAIDAYWKSSWFHRVAASIKSKFLNIILFSLGSTNWVATLKTEHNWDTTVVTNQDKDIDSSNRFVKQSLDNNLVNSLRFTVQNDVSGEGMLVTAFEYETQDTQRRPKT